MIQHSEVTVESIKAIQKDWDAATIKSKQASTVAKGVITRREFDKLPAIERGRYIKAGIKIVD